MEILRSAPLAYLPFGETLVRPPPEGLPVLLGQPPSPRPLLPLWLPLLPLPWLPPLPPRPLPDFAIFSPPFTRWDSSPHGETPCAR